MRIVCQQTILTKYAFFYFWKSCKIWNCRLLQIIGGALRVNELTSIPSKDILQDISNFLIRIWSAIE